MTFDVNIFDILLTIVNGIGNICGILYNILTFEISIPIGSEGLTGLVQFAVNFILSRFGYALDTSVYVSFSILEIFAFTSPVIIITLFVLRLIKKYVPIV